MENGIYKLNFEVGYGDGSANPNPVHQVSLPGVHDLLFPPQWRHYAPEAVDSLRPYISTTSPADHVGQELDQTAPLPLRGNMPLAGDTNTLDQSATPSVGRPPLGESLDESPNDTAWRGFKVAPLGPVHFQPAVVRLPKVFAKDACAECGYRPKGDPQWFRSTMARHKRTMHSARPLTIYHCPYPGCESSYKNRPDNLRQHQINKNHFVGDSSPQQLGGREAPSCAECGYRPTGDLKLFGRRMERHKSKMHSPNPSIVYQCSYPGCEKQYKNGRRSLRRHQIAKNHFVNSF